MAKAITLADYAHFERRLAGFVDDIAQAVCDESLEGEVHYARFVLRNGVKNGYNRYAGEAWMLRIRRAGAEKARELAKVERPAGALNVHGLDTAYFRARLQRVLPILNHYTPAEFARECGRMARTADPVVLAEDEFQ